MPTLVQSFTELPLVSRLRRNHGLEHATLHVLSAQHPQVPMAGHSSPGGFVLVGELSTENVQEAVAEAVRRLKAGEHRLAVHPNCGTNYVAAGTLAGLAGVSAMLGVGKRLRDKLERLPLVASMATVALILAQPLALRLQEHVTTSGELGDLEVVEIVRVQQGPFTAHRIITRG